MTCTSGTPASATSRDLTFCVPTNNKQHLMITARLTVHTQLHTHRCVWVQHPYPYVCIRNAWAHTSLLGTDVYSKAGGPGIRGRRDRGKMKSFSCGLFAATIFCLLTPSSCSPPPCSAGAGHLASATRQLPGAGEVPFCHCARCMGTAEAFQSLGTNSKTCLGFHVSGVKGTRAFARLATCAVAREGTAMAARLSECK